MREEQIAVLQPNDVAHPADEVTQTWERIRTIVIVTGDADACLF
jgi:hypothetical protein